MEDKDLFSFLMNYGLPEDHGIENIRINRGDKNTWVVVEGLDNEDVQMMNKNIHFPISRQKYFDVPIYCRPLRNMTPLKPLNKDTANNQEESQDAGSPKLAKDTVTPKSDNRIPGLSKNQRKKANKKARLKKNTEDDSESESDNSFLKSAVDSFVFEEPATPASRPGQGSKFFSRTPLDDELLSDRRIQKEEMWKSQIQNQQSLQLKRLSSPDQDQVRNLRLKHD